MTIVVSCNRKGGVGKTTVALHLVWAAKAMGMSVLLVDLDTQGNASHILLADLEDRHPGTGAECLFTSDPLANVLEINGLHVLPATPHLDGLDGTFRLPAALELRTVVRALPYDLIVFDTPPAMGLRQTAPLLFANRAIIPIHLEVFSVQGLRGLIHSLQSIGKVNPDLRWQIQPNAVQIASASQSDLLTRLKTFFNSGVILPSLTHRQAVKNAIAEGIPVWDLKDAEPDLRRQWRTQFETYVQQITENNDG